MESFCDAISFQHRETMAAEIVSIVIPVLNEDRYIGSTLEGLRSEAGVEIIVVDGGSKDNTVKTAVAKGVRVLSSAPGRAIQMNTGAGAASGDILLFLHADTRLPAGFGDAVRTALADPQVAAGAFRLRIAASGLRFRLLERLVCLRSALFAMPYGDQALFLTARIFQDAGGFVELPIMEDFEFICRLRKKGRIRILPQAAATSARRWRRFGIFRTTVLNQLLIIGYLCGVAPRRLARWYGRE